MECVRCEKELHEEEIEYDYVGNEWCKECMEEEMKHVAFNKTANVYLPVVCGSVRALTSVIHDWR